MLLEGFTPYQNTLGKVVWADKEPALSHFAGITEDETMYQVHLGESSAIAEDDFIEAVIESFSKAISYADTNVQENTFAIRVNWSYTPAILTITYGDEDWQKDSPHVVKCCFGEIEELLTQDFQEFMNKLEQEETEDVAAEEDQKSILYEEETTTEMPDDYFEVVCKGLERAIAEPMIHKVLLRLKEKNIGVYVYVDDEYQEAQQVF
jgi:hypothetical protein